ILSGLLRACEKRPISVAQLEQIVDDAEKEVQESLDRELSTSEIGKVIMRRLKTIDKVAYVRFASVYLEFEDVSAFMNELKALVSSRSTNNVAVRKPELEKKKKKK
ncbi:MAG: ATP cone domain-containing protein, partial [bacterium]|nr:ATP cone domain-containing protein [bacterium]